MFGHGIHGKHFMPVMFMNAGDKCLSIWMYNKMYPSTIQVGCIQDYNNTVRCNLLFIVFFLQMLRRFATVICAVKK